MKKLHTMEAGALTNDKRKKDWVPTKAAEYFVQQYEL